MARNRRKQRRNPNGRYEVMSFRVSPAEREFIEARIPDDTSNNEFLRDMVLTTAQRMAPQRREGQHGKGLD